MRTVRQVRILKEYSMDEVFLKTGISISRLSRIERGIYQATEKEKELIAHALGEPEEKVFPWEEK